jgi:hypothetical protein
MTQASWSLLIPALVVLAVLLLALIVAGMVVSARSSAVHFHAAYVAFAKQVGGQLVADKNIAGFLQPREVHFFHGKTQCLLAIDIELGGTSHNEHPGRTYFLRMSFDLGRETPFRCNLQPQWLPKLLSGVVRVSDAHLGWDEFDRRFIVQTNDELRAPDILHRPVQVQLMQISQAALAMSPLEAGHVTLTVEGRTVAIRMQGILDEIDQLTPFYQLCGRLFDLLAPRLP